MRNAAWILLFAAGCAAGSARYSETDNRKTISADLDTVFYVSLPEAMNAKAVFSPNVLTLNKDAVDPAAHQRVLEFTARALGETEIKVGADFSLRVQVTSVSDRPSMHIHQH